ncbi:hypothetical protein SELMODRAFT_409970 [Selaginella moellendorffii]|uniref:Uncharacterized protein n=1 Tax=Selaginella moellendorffii TaxID=88036 RepID=D8RD20_SELML|nr:hypothetical protein SELMODRAFT_409970 [Selaginella moellendorffii]
MYKLEFHCPIAREQELCPWHLELWRQMPSSPFELDLHLKCHPEALLEGVEMPQDRDEIHIEQTEEEQVENPAENSPTPSHPTTVAHSPDPTAAACPTLTTQNVRRWMQGLGMNNTFGIDLAFFNLPNGLPPLQSDTTSFDWIIFLKWWMWHAI